MKENEQRRKAEGEQEEQVWISFKSRLKRWKVGWGATTGMSTVTGVWWHGASSGVIGIRDWG